MTPKRFGVFLSVLSYVVNIHFAQGTSFIRFDCELLPIEDCAFAVGQGGRRCLLETTVGLDGSIVHYCQTSNIQWGSDSRDSRRELRSVKSSGHVESDQCLDACGLKRLTVGISTDGLQTGAFKEKICSDECQHDCPEIINLYNVIYAEEGEELARVCDELFQWKQSERERARRLSETFAATTEPVSAPAPAPDEPHTTS